MPLHLLPALPAFVAIRAIALVVLAGFFYSLPRRSRYTVYFSVTVRPEFRDLPEARQILRRYRSAVLAHALIGAAIFLAGLGRDWPPAFAAAFAWLLAGCVFALHRARRETSPHATPPSTLREASLDPRDNRIPGGWWLQLGPFAILLAAALAAHAHGSRLPDRFPIHWGLAGHANGWASRSLFGVYDTFFEAAGLSAFLLFVNYLVTFRARRIHAAGVAAGRERRLQRATVWTTTACSYFSAVLAASAPFLASRGQTPNPAVMAAISIAFALALILAAMHSMRTTGEDKRAAVDASGAPVGDRTEDRHWKWGFYINPQDPAIIVEKRLGLGYTFNLGHPLGRLIMAAIPVIVVLAIVLGSHGGS